MAHKSFNRIRETATAPGTGSFTLNGAVQGAQTFGSRLASTNRVWYAATNGTAWEVGYGTFTSPTTLARTTILESSNADAVVNFSAGIVDIFCDLPASVTDTLNLIEETVTSAATFDIGAVHAMRILASGTTGPVTSLGTTPNKMRIVRWAGATVNHHATSLILIGGVNWVTEVNDISLLVSDGSGNWRELFRRYATDKTPTTQVFTSGSGTYTTPARVRRLEIELIGGGGGGGGSGTASATNGGSGGNTTFSTLTGNGGAGGVAGVGLAGGNGGAGGAASGGYDNIPGGVGGNGGSSGIIISGATGGNGIFGGAGSGGSGVDGPKVGATNTGAGGGGGLGNTTYNAAGGGGAGGAVRAIINAPAATYSYAVGAAGTAGAIGTSGQAGAAGAAGKIIVREYY